MVEWTQIGIVIGAPVVRSLLGWLENAAEDGKIEKFEWTRGLATLFRVGTISTMTYFGLNAGGFQVDAVATSAASILIDMIYVKMYSEDRRWIK